jgi:hypothetical protein
MVACRPPGRVEHVLQNGPNVAEGGLPAGRQFRMDLVGLPPSIPQRPLSVGPRCLCLELRVDVDGDALSFGLRLDDDPVCLPTELFDVVEGSNKVGHLRAYALGAVVRFRLELPDPGL